MIEWAAAFFAPLTQALTESIGHGIFTVELMAGVLTGLVFMGMYVGKGWWQTQAGRLAMGNMFALTLLAAGGLLFRLGWQNEALTLLLPACAVLLLVMVWWVRQLRTAQNATSEDFAGALAEAAEVLSARLADEGRIEDAEAAFKQSRLLAQLSVRPPS